ncbi:FecR family protein [Seonamhaeicola sp.]|uniref:FecR family protein n=1 Tax=Seonamhaeicola sp. TaxID=1912245 RepID=UPI002608894A|nr:FecR family protein [Seonamhaeicola sp.]
MEEQFDDTFLARWLANELSEKELESFKGSEAYKEYSEIIDSLDNAEFPSYDLNYNFEATLKKIEKSKNQNHGTRRLILNWSYGIAAALVLCFGYFLFFDYSNFKTNATEQMAFILPDSSKVNLNAGSKISFKSFNWEKNRTLKLQGEAFFEVKKGASFTVNTKEGQVVVLGTKFTVNSRDSLYSVSCFEGKVEVLIENKTPIILNKGDAVTLQKDTLEASNFNKTSPVWLEDKSSFTKISIFEVVSELERQFGVSIQGKSNLRPAYFSGQFSHNSLEKALKTIFTAMDIPYEFKDKNSIYILPY